MSENQNIKQNKMESDIFNMKPQAEEAPIKRRYNNRSSYDLLAWDTSALHKEPNPKDLELIKNKKAVESNTTKSTIFQRDPLPPSKVRVIKGNQTTMCLGNDDGSEYQVHKEKPKEYDPNKYYKEETPYQRKLEQYYGPDIKAIPTKKISYGTINDELQKNDNEKNKIVYGNSAKLCKFRELYMNNNKGIEQPANLDPIISKNSTGVKFDDSKECTYNRVEQLKSNIFNDPQKANQNQTVCAQKLVYKDPGDDGSAQYGGRKNFPRNNQFNKDAEIVSAKLDWIKVDTSKYYKKDQGHEGDNDTAHNRKMNDLYGCKESNDQYCIQKKGGDDGNDKRIRKEFEDMYQIYDPKAKESEIKKRAEMVSFAQGKNFVGQNPQRNAKLEGNEPKTYTYEVKDFTNIDRVNTDEIQKLFKSRGLHIFGMNSDNSYNTPNQKGRLYFSVRENKNDENFDSKMNECKNILKEQQGLSVADVENPKKELCENFPATLGWDSSKYNGHAKGRKLGTTLEGQTHYRGVAGSEKITQIGPINHKYKKK